MDLFGSDLEKLIKAASANGEPQWVGVGDSIALLVWRIEQFRVVPWPKSKYGKFHEGDSYIVCNTYKASPEAEKFSYDIHFWIGSYSTQDEYGTAAYKTVELDNILKGAAVQHRWVGVWVQKLYMLSYAMDFCLCYEIIPNSSVCTVLLK